jgi:hypothetical protein
MAKHPMLSDEVDVKDYGGINIPMSEQDKNTPIPEPSFEAPQFDMDDEDEDFEEPVKKEKKEKEPFNEDLEDLTPTEKKKQAEQMANMAIGVYEYLHQFPESFSKFNERKIKDLHIKGEINLYATIPLNGSVSTIEQVIKEYNSDITGVFTVSNEFKDNVRPILTRILQKRGVGLTDEEMLAYYVVMDLVQKGQIFFQLMKQKKETLDQLKEISNNLRTTGSVNTTPDSNKPAENSAPSPLADNEVQNVKKDGTIETIEIEEEDEPKASKRGRPKKKLNSYSYEIKTRFLKSALKNQNKYVQSSMYL